VRLLEEKCRILVGCFPLSSLRDGVGGADNPSPLTAHGCAMEGRPAAAEALGEAPTRQPRKRMMSGTTRLGPVEADEGE
jgi:hypothetical protein